MPRPASEHLHALLAFHGLAADAELSDADLETVVGGKARRRDKSGSSESRKPSGDGGADPKLDKFFERQNQNSNPSRNQN